MYNRYIPDWEGQAAQGPEFRRAAPGGRPGRPPSRPAGLSGLAALLSREGLGGLLRSLGWERLDGGDLLLLLILLLILTEGEDLEPAAALGLVVLMVLMDGGDG